MKTYKWIIILIFGIVLSSCQEYLERTPEADVTEEDIFGNFQSFQGFVESMYSHVLCYTSQSLVNSLNLGGETHSLAIANGAKVANDGNYMVWYRESGSNIQQTLYNLGGETGMWTGSWKGIRTANIALDKLPLLKNATQEEKDLIAGQAYFFRAFFYWELIRSVGGMPYIDRALQPNDILDFPRLSYQETTDKMVEDFDRAAALLPVHWNDTEVGSRSPGANTGKATKGAALAFKAKALLFAGSPLMNKFSGAADYTYDMEYMQKAAAAAWDMIQLANTGAYGLVDFADYQKNFGRNDGIYPWTKETIFMRIDDRQGSSLMSNRHGRLFNPGRFGGNQVMECVNQLYVDKFEMADGTRYLVDYDNDNARRWDDRDPRFRQNIIVDRDQWGFSPSTVLRLYTGTGTEKTANNGFTTAYVIKKYWPIGANTYDGQLAGFYYRTPHIRLADIYLVYAEAVNEAYGATGTAPGANLTAVEAVNIVRRRAGMPDATAAAPGYDSFRDLIRNERAVELCFEGHYWFDTRRWYIAHLPENKLIVDLIFDQAWTSFQRQVVHNRVFDDPKHYWMPLPVSQTQIYEEFYQNPGW
jgi:starch-binding outer membrane protein, SusD/RagB family